MLTISEKNDQRKSLAIAIAFHTLLFLILFLIKIGYNPQPIEEDGGSILINFGNTETGIGDVIPESTQTTSEPTPPESNPQKTSEVVTQNIEQTVSIKDDKKTKINTDKTKVTIKPTEQVVKTDPKPKVTFPGKNNNNITSQGKNGTKGDAGKINGDPNTNGKSDTGGGNNIDGKNGSGIGLSMSGRDIIKYPSVKDNSQKTGKIVVNIKVNKFGKVIFAKATQQGSTNFDPYLVMLSEKAAYETVLTSSTDLIEQFGKMTFIYSVK